jgi:hypothetical protein
MDKTKLAGLLIVLAVIVGYLVLTFDKKQSQESTSTASLTTKTVLDGLAQKLEVKPELRASIYTDWLENDNTVVPLTGQQFFMGTVTITDIEQYNNIKDINDVTVANLMPIVTSADAYFSSIGFSKSKSNTNSLGSPPVKFQTLGYENNDMKCVIRLDEQTDPFGNFFCGKVDKAQMTLQKEMGTMLPYKLTKDGISSLRVQKIEGDYAIGTYSEAYSGYTWMAKKDGNTWKILWKSNDIAPCADMERLGIPKSIYGDCYSPS